MEMTDEGCFLTQKHEGRKGNLRFEIWNAKVPEGRPKVTHHFNGGKA